LRAGFFHATATANAPRRDAGISHLCTMLVVIDESTLTVTIAHARLQVTACVCRRITSPCQEISTANCNQPRRATHATALLEMQCSSRPRQALRVGAPFFRGQKPHGC